MVRGVLPSLFIIAFFAHCTLCDPPSGCSRPRSESHDISGGIYALKGSTCSVHDPAIAIEGGLYYVFGTDTTPQGSFTGNLLIRCGQSDNATFSVCSQVFKGLPAWSRPLVPTASNIWAPDISFFNGVWNLYYAISEFGQPISVIGHATTKTLNPTAPGYGWTDHGLIIATNGSQGYNAIDPSIFFDEKGQIFMVLGSFWQGIQLIRLTNNGTRDTTFPITRLATRANPGAIEGSFILLRHSYYYLFVSWNFCCRGTASTYEVRVGRAQQPSGPYIDQDGVDMRDGGGTKIMGGSYGWAAAGGEALLRETAESNITTIVVHAYDGVSGDPWLQLVGLQWNSQAWPEVVPLKAGRL